MQTGWLQQIQLNHLAASSAEPHFSWCYTHAEAQSSSHPIQQGLSAHGITPTWPNPTFTSFGRDSVKISLITQLILLQPLSLEMLGLTPAEKGRQAEHLKRARERSEEECKDLYVQLLVRELEGTYNTVYKDFTGKKGKKVEDLAQQERHLKSWKGYPEKF